MKNNYKAMFDDLAPVMGDEELLKAVLDRKAKNKMGVKLSKKIFIPVIAAAAMGATAIGAGAAHQWSLGHSIEQVIESGGGSLNVDYPKYDLYKLGGKELNDVAECGGFDIRALGIAADDHTAYLFYDIVFDESFDYSLGDNEEWSCWVAPFLDPLWAMDYWGIDLEKRDELPHPSMNGHTGVLGTDGNVVHMYSVFTISGITLPGKTLKYECSGLYRCSAETKDCVGESLGGFMEGFSVDIDFETAGSRVVKPNKSVKLVTGEIGTIKFVEVSLFMFYAEIDWSNLDRITYPANRTNINGKFDVENPTLDTWMASLKIKFRDGTVKDINTFAISNSSSASDALKLAWEYPVDVEEIESVIIGNVEVAL